MSRKQTSPLRNTARPSSLIWRALTRYGHIKYRHLLPVYHLLESRGKAKPAGTKQLPRTLRAASAVARVLDRTSGEFYDQQATMVADRVEKCRGVMIFLPSTGWNISSTQRLHFLAREFSRQGYVSIFDCSNAYDDVNGFKEIESNLFLFRGPAKILSDLPDPLLWTLTYNYDRREEYPASAITIYDVIDDLDVFAYERSFLQQNHLRALREATLVTCTARRLYDRALESRPDALYLPNGVEDWRFMDTPIGAPNDPDLAELRREGKPIAGYYGSLAQWFDYDLLDEIARMRPDWNFLLVGPTLDTSLKKHRRNILKRSNVRWIGYRAYTELPNYLSVFDAATIPFVINEVTLSTSPLKLYEYFAGGKPVITTAMPECQAFPEVHAVGNALEFSTALDVALREGRNETFQNRLRAVVKENSWSSRVRLVLEHLHAKRSAVE